MESSDLTLVIQATLFWAVTYLNCKELLLHENISIFSLLYFTVCTHLYFCRMSGTFFIIFTSKKTTNNNGLSLFKCVC